MQPGDRVMYFGQSGTVVHGNNAPHWLAKLDNGHEVSAPASAFTPVEDEKPKRWRQCVSIASGPVASQTVTLDLIEVGGHIRLDTARIAAPVVLEKLKEIISQPEDKVYTKYGAVFNCLEKSIADLEKEVADGE